MTIKNYSVYILFLCVFCFLPFSCDDTAGPEGNGPEDNTNPNLYGNFTIKLAEAQGTEEAYVSVLGSFKDGPAVSSVIWQEIAQEGDCKLETPLYPPCEPSCGVSAACVAENQCVDHPKPQDLGTVTLSGVQTSDGKIQFTMDPLNKKYQPIGLTLAYPAFDEGADISLAVGASDNVSAFSVATKGIQPLELISTDITLDENTPMNLKWKAPTNSSISKMHVYIDISHHGGIRGVVTCETNDDGELDVSASLLSRLKELGISGYPKIEMTRKSVGKTGKVELLVQSKVTRLLTIPGLTSCMQDEQCPPGETCRWDAWCE